MTRSEAQTRLTQIRKELNSILITKRNAVALFKAGELTEAGYNELRNRENTLEAEFRSVSKLHPSI